MASSNQLERSLSRCSDSASISSPSFRRLFFGRRFSNGSTYTVNTINTVLPDYTEVDPNSPQDSPHSASSTQLPFDIDSSDATTICSNRDQGNASSGCVTTTLGISAPRCSFITSTVSHYGPGSSLTTFLENISGHPVARKFHYSYPIKSNDAWATLHLYTHEALPGNPCPSKTQPNVPRIWSCNPISGMIELDLSSPQSIQQIKVVLKGKLQTTSLDGGVFRFMRNEFTIWQRSFGNPRDLNASQSSSNKEFDDIFIGRYSFPFSFPFPSYIDVQNNSATLRDTNPVSPFLALAATPTSPSTLSPLSHSRPPDYEMGKLRKSSLVFGTTPNSFAGASNQGIPPETPVDKKKPSGYMQQTCNRSLIDSVASRVPHTFVEKGIPGTIVYEISAIITHGRFKPDSKIKTNICYIPAIHPHPVSRMRRQAYESSSSAPGPMQDPTGWFELSKATSFGLFSDDVGQRQVAIDCILYLAQPLSYTRGAIIPCFLKLFSNDTGALQNLGVPTVPVVRLLRRLQHFDQNAAYVLDPEHYSLGHPSICSNLLVPCTGKAPHFSVIHEVGMARWKVPFSDDIQQASVKLLEGEIHLSNDLMASCSCDILRVEYFVEMMALQSSHFEAILSPSAPGPLERRSIASVPVEITTLRRVDEPIPVAFTEPPKPYKERIHMEDTFFGLKETEGKQ